MSEPKIFLSAGETSGDLHGASLAQELRSLFPQARLVGLAGPRMREAGVQPLVDFDKLIVMGFAEVLAKLPFFLRLQRRVRQLLEEEPPDLVIPIDYPGFNLRLTADAHRRGCKVLYYIAPQVWAWRPERAGILAESADRVAVVFPQEEEFLQKSGVDAVFVGHPLLDEAEAWEGRKEAISGLDADPQRPILGLLPGSRPQEVRRLLVPFVHTARKVLEKRPDVQVMVSEAPSVPSALYGPAGEFRRVADSGAVLSASTAVLTKSGTTTIEATIRGTPLIIGHRVNPLSYLLARRLIKVEHIGMVNVLAGRAVVPEFVQDLPPGEMANALLPLLEESSRERRAMVAELTRVREMLGEPGAPRRVAELARQVIEGR